MASLTALMTTLVWIDKTKRRASEYKETCWSSGGFVCFSSSLCSHCEVFCPCHCVCSLFINRSVTRHCVRPLGCLFVSMIFFSLLKNLYVTFSFIMFFFFYYCFQKLFFRPVIFLSHWCTLCLFVSVSVCHYKLVSFPLTKMCFVWLANKFVCFFLRVLLSIEVAIWWLVNLKIN